MKQEEHINQCMLIDWFYHNPKTKDYLLFAIPNGGKRNVITAMKLKREGVIAGVPDLFLAHAKSDDIYINNPLVGLPVYGCKFYHGLFIEMKSKKGKLTDNQISITYRLRQAEYKIAICHSFEDAKKAIEEYLNI